MNIRKLFRSYTAAENFCTTHDIKDFNIIPTENNNYILDYNWQYSESEDRKLFISGALVGYLDSHSQCEQPKAMAELMEIIFNYYTRKEAADIIQGITGAFFEYYDKE